MFFRIPSFVIFMRGVAERWLSWEKLMYFKAIEFINLWLLSFLVVNLLVNNSKVFWFRIVLLQCLLAWNSTISLLSKDTLDFQICFKLLLNKFIIIGSETLYLLIFDHVAFILNTCWSIGTSFHYKIKSLSIGPVEVMEVYYLVFTTCSSTFWSLIVSR